MLVLACPHCSGQFQVPPQAAGQVISCPHCQRPVRAPLPPAAPPAPQVVPVRSAETQAQEPFEEARPVAPAPPPAARPRQNPLAGLQRLPLLDGLPETARRLGAPLGTVRVRG